MNKLLIFIWYLVSQPWIELGKFVKSIFEKGATLNYPRTWQYIFAILVVGAYLTKNRFLTMIFGVMLFATIIKTEWDRGYFVEKYRKKIEEKAIKKMQERKENIPKGSDSPMEGKK
mgnify:CR=1 FL=1